MSKYLVTYDLRQPGRNYNSLHTAIKAVGTSYVHPLESVWLVASSHPATVLRDHLRQQIDANDVLFITALTGEAAWIGIEQNDAVLRWFERN